MYDEAEMLWTITDRANGQYEKQEYSIEQTEKYMEAAKAWRMKDEWTIDITRPNAEDTHEEGTDYIRIGIAELLIDENGEFAGIVRQGGLREWHATKQQNTAGYFALLLTSTGNIDYTEITRDEEGNWEKTTKDVYTLVKAEDVK